MVGRSACVDHQLKKEPAVSACTRALAWGAVAWEIAPEEMPENKGEQSGAEDSSPLLPIIRAHVRVPSNVKAAHCWN